MTNSSDMLVQEPKIEGTLLVDNNKTSDRFSSIAAGAYDRTANNISSLKSPLSHTDSSLPELKLPAAADRQVVSAHDQLVSKVDSSLSNPSDRQKFRQDMDAFEKRADSQGLKPEQIKETYKQLGDMLDGTNNKFVTKEQRLQITSQWMSRLADPTTNVRQGNHDTCGLAVLEVRLLSQNPEIVTKKMAEVLNTGSLTVYNRDGKTMSGATDTTDTLPDTIKISIPKDSFKPDQEATGESTNPNARSHADQIFQIMAGNIKWGNKYITPGENGQATETGSMHYEQCQTIKIPKAGQESNSSTNQSCESVTYIDPKTGREVRETAGGYGFGGQMTVVDLLETSAVITGKVEQVSMTSERNGAAAVVRNESELNAQLEKLQKSGNFPFAAMVGLNNEVLTAEYLRSHPERTAATVPKDGAHLIAITGVLPNGDVSYYNPWGYNGTMTRKQLVEALQSRR